MREQTATDFGIDVAGVGRFAVARRTMRDEFRIAAEYSRLTEGVETPTVFLHVYARAFATALVLVSQAPDGFDLETLDPLEEASYATLMAVHSAIVAQEDRFRGQPGARSQAGGSRDGGDRGPVVPQEVQPAAQ